MEVRVVGKIAEDQKDKVSAMIVEAFSRKLLNLVYSTRSRNKVHRVLRKSLDFGSALYAIRGGEVVGVAGLLTHTRSFLRHGPVVLCREFGLLGGLGRFIANVFFDLFSLPRGGRELHLQLVCVDRRLRGRGIGTSLLRAAFAYARRRGFKRVSLEVVDSNSRAKRLYEGEGFVTKRHDNIPFLTRGAGFDGVFWMERDLSTCDLSISPPIPKTR
ncbi:MAG: GNAT family N-acetyltransferase [Promethearchaeota archaeon]